MTYKEKLAELYPEWTEKQVEEAYLDFCPHHLLIGAETDYERCTEDATDEDCADCWNREVISEDITRYGSSEETEPTIKDSGDRTQFESGAVRDMRTGKGRFDVMPLEVISDMLGTKERNHDPIVLDIATFMYEKDTSWLEAALDNFAEMAYGGCLYTMFLEVAKHYEEGAIKYAPDNWRHGIPIWCYIDSAMRHYMKYRRGDGDENHHLAFVWNVMCCIWEVDYGDEWRKSKEEVK